MRPYSDDLRKRVVDAYLAKEGTMLALAERFFVSESFVTKLWVRWLETGSTDPRPHGGGKARVLEAADLKAIEQILKVKPDSTLPELCAALAERRGKSVSCPTMSRALAGLGKSRKKNASGKRGRYARSGA